MNNLLGKYCLITGGSKGIGLEIGRKFAQKGANIILLSRNRQNLEYAVKTLPKHNGNQSHCIVEFDVSKGQNITENDIGMKLGLIDILINNAGLSQTSLLMTTKLETIRSIIDTNLVGTIVMSQSFIKPMIRKKGGCIINIASILAARGVRGSTVYSASKAGIIGFTQSLAAELHGRNIRVNCISPGLTDTDMASSE